MKKTANLTDFNVKIINPLNEGINYYFNHIGTIFEFRNRIYYVLFFPLGSIQTKNVVFIAKSFINTMPNSSKKLNKINIKLKIKKTLLTRMKLSYKSTVSLLTEVKIPLPSRSIRLCDQLPFVWI